MLRYAFEANFEPPVPTFFRYLGKRKGCLTQRLQDKSTAYTSKFISNSTSLRVVIIWKFKVSLGFLRGSNSFWGPSPHAVLFSVLLSRNSPKDYSRYFISPKIVQSISPEVYLEIPLEILPETSPRIPSVKSLGGYTRTISSTIYSHISPVIYLAIALWFFWGIHAGISPGKHLEILLAILMDISSGIPSGYVLY